MGQILKKVEVGVPDIVELQKHLSSDSFREEIRKA